MTDWNERIAAELETLANAFKAKRKEYLSLLEKEPNGPDAEVSASAAGAWSDAEYRLRARVAELRAAAQNA